MWLSLFTLFLSRDLYWEKKRNIYKSILFILFFFSLPIFIVDYLTITISITTNAPSLHQLEMKTKKKKKSKKKHKYKKKKSLFRYSYFMSLYGICMPTYGFIEPNKQKHIRYHKWLINRINWLFFSFCIYLYMFASFLIEVSLAVSFFPFFSIMTFCSLHRSEAKHLSQTCIHIFTPCFIIK